jgi:hypothetical protein
MQTPRPSGGPKSIRGGKRSARLQRSDIAMSGDQFPVEAAPNALSQVQGQTRPVILTSNKSGDLRTTVKHREYIGEVLSSIAYAVTEYAINPAIAATFPWLSTLAMNFEAYLFKKLKFDYRTESSTQATGKAILSVDYDAADPAPATKQEQLQARTKVDCATWQNAGVSCDSSDLKKLPQRYTRVAPLPANMDIKTYDVGKLSVGCQGQTADNVPMGELYVEYEVDLITPTNSGVVVQALMAQKIVASGAGLTTTQLFGNAPVLTGAALFQVNPVNSEMTLQVAGQYMITSIITGTTIAGLTAGYAGVDTNVNIIINAAGTVAINVTIVNGVVGDAWIPFLTAATVSAAQHFITPYPYALGV